jgi:HlyD family secretion protein
MKLSLSYFKKHSTVSIAAGIFVLLIAAIAAQSAKKSNIDDSGLNSKPVVQLLSAKDFSQGLRTVSANGTVESLEQAELRSQSNGKITKVNVVVGQKVSRGQVLVTLDQASQAAALTSARGALAQAQANYNRVMSGASSEDISVAQVALDSAKSGLESTKRQQQVAVDNALKALLNSGLAAIEESGNNGGVTVSISGAYAGKEEGFYRISIYATGSGLRYQYNGLESGNGIVDTSPQPLGTRGLYVQFSSTAVPVNESWIVNIPNTQSAGYVANNNAYQAALQGQISAVTAAENAVSAAQAALDLKKSEARPAEVQAAQAQILTAQGQVQAASAALENTIVRAPFSGVISAVSVKYGDLVTVGSSVASIVSQGGLQIKIFVSDLDLASINPGDQAKIGKDEILGTVTNVAPSVSASTKTAEVNVAVNEPDKSGLTVGQNVQVYMAGKDNSHQAKESFVLPLQAVKITPDNKAYVYTLEEENKAKENLVEVGKVDGENVEVVGGMSVDMQILSNAYGVSEGDKVEIQK